MKLFPDRKPEESKPPEYRHSFMFRRFFEDFKTYEYVDPDGKVHSKSVYAGRIYTPPFSPARYRLRKLLYFALWLAAGVLVYYAGSRALPVNMSPVTVALQIAEIVCMCWVLIGVCNYCLAPYQRTIGEQKTSAKALLTGTVWAMAALCAAAAESVVFLFIARSRVPLQLLCIGFYLVAAALLYALRTLEKRVAYEITFAAQEETAPPDDAEENAE